MKNKKFLKIVGATTLATLTGLSLASCGDKDDNNNDDDSVITNYTVVFNSNDPDTTDNITPTAFDNKTVKSGGTVTLPTPVYDGYTFDGWFKDQALTLEWTATSKVESDVTLYAKWTRIDEGGESGGGETTQSVFERLTTAEGNVISTQFDNGTVVNNDDYIPTIPGLVSRSNQTTSLSVSVADGKFVVSDSDISASAEGYLAMGMLYEGTVEGTFKYTPVNTSNNTNGSWTMAQFYGYKGFDGNLSKLFGLRTNSDKKVQLYVGDTFYGNAFTYAANTEYEIYFKYDFNTKKLTITINETAIVENYDLAENYQPLFLTGIGFITAGSATDRGAKVDDYAVAVSNAGTLADVKAYFESLVDEVYAGMDLDNDYSFTKEYIVEGFNGGKAQLAAATTKEAALNILLAGMEELSDCQTDTEIKDEAKAEINDYKDEIQAGYTVNATQFNAAFETAINSVDAATSYAQIYDIYDALNNAIDNIDSDYEIRNEKAGELDSYYDEKIAEVDLSGLDSETLTNLNGEIEAFYDKYLSFNIGLLYTCEMSELDNTLADAKSELDGIISKYSQSLEDYIAELTANFATYKATKLAEAGIPQNSIVYAGINSMTITFDDSVTNNAAALAVYNARCQDVDDAIELELYKDDAFEEYISYYNEQVETLLIGKSTFEADYATSIDSIQIEFEDNLFLVSSKDAVDTVLASAKEDLDSLIADVKANTELTVTFKASQSSDAFIVVNALINGTVTEPEDEPTLDGYSFAGWDFDFNTALTADTTIYANWNDLYTVTSGVLSTVTFKGMSAIPVGDDNNDFGVKNKDVAYTVDGVTYTSHNTSSSAFAIETNGLKLSKAGQSITFDAEAGATVTIIVRNSTNDGTRVCLISSTTGLDLSVVKNYTLPTGITGVVVENGKDSTGGNDGNCTKLIITANVAQTITIACGGSNPNTIHVQQIKVDSFKSETTVVGGVSANVVAYTNRFIVSDVKLIPYGFSSVDDYIAITEGYSVEVYDSTNQLVANENLESGIYTILVKYGTYTFGVFQRSIEEPI